MATGACIAAVPARPAPAGSRSDRADACWRVVPAAAEMVLKCIRAEPRWDSQLDSRADYYAQLMPTVGISIDKIVDLVAARLTRRSPSRLTRVRQRGGLLGPWNVVLRSRWTVRWTVLSAR